MQLAWPLRYLALFVFAITFPDASLTTPLDPTRPSVLESPSSLLSNSPASPSVNNTSHQIDSNSTSSFYDVLPAALGTNPECDYRYGHDLVRHSCEEALQKIGTTLNMFSVVTRGEGRRAQMILPNRWSSCKHNFPIRKDYQNRDEA